MWVGDLGALGLDLVGPLAGDGSLDLAEGGLEDTELSAAPVADPDLSVLGQTECLVLSASTEDFVIQTLEKI